MGLLMKQGHQDVLLCLRGGWIYANGSKTSPKLLSNMNRQNTDAYSLATHHFICSNVALDSLCFPMSSISVECKFCSLHRVWVWVVTTPRKHKPVWTPLWVVTHVFVNSYVHKYKFKWIHITVWKTGGPKHLAYAKVDHLLSAWRSLTSPFVIFSSKLQSAGGQNHVLL